MTNYFTPPKRNLCYFMRIYSPRKSHHGTPCMKGTASLKIGVSHTATPGLSHTGTLGLSHTA